MGEGGTTAGRVRESEEVGCRSVQSGDVDLWRSLTCNLLQDDATVKCWGYNGNGELGQGDTKGRGDHSGGGCPLGPLGFEGAQHRQTLCASVDGIRSKALRPFGL